MGCYYKRNCVELEGMYTCRDGMCSHLTNWQCERNCVDIPVTDRNIISMAGDKILTSHCRVAVNSRTGEEIWNKDQHPDTILVTSCTTLDLLSDSEVIRGADCVNGTLLPTT